MMKKTLNKLLRIFCIETKDMKKFLKREMKKYPEMTKGHFGYDFLFYRGTLPVLLVAHIDTVHKEMPTLESICIYKGKVAAPFTGLGADDRLGVFGILEMLERGYRPHVLFTDREETGGHGAKEFARFIKRYPKLAPEINFMVELDRMNENDAAMYQCGNKNFVEFLSLYGYTKATGTYTDICDIMPAMDRAGTNISVGYYRQHTQSEYFVISEYYKNMDRLEAILYNADAQPVYLYEEKSYSYTNYRSRGGYYNNNYGNDLGSNSSSTKDKKVNYNALTIFEEERLPGIKQHLKPTSVLDEDGNDIPHLAHCDNCNDLFHEDDLKYVDGEFYCEDCLDYAVPYYKARGL